MAELLRYACLRMARRTTHGPLVCGDRATGESLQADVTSSSPDGSTVQVKVVDAALPDQSDEAMCKAAKGSLARSLKSEALVRRHQAQLLDKSSRLRRAQHKINELEGENKLLRLQVEKAKAEKKSAGASPTSESKGISHTIMEDKNETQCKSLAGLSSHESLQVSLRTCPVGSVGWTLSG